MWKVGDVLDNGWTVIGITDSVVAAENEDQTDCATWRLCYEQRHTSNGHYGMTPKEALRSMVNRS